MPYNPDPKKMKIKTDRAKELLQEINSTKLDENKMKPREVKALAQVLTGWIFSKTFNKMIFNVCITYYWI